MPSVVPVRTVPIDPTSQLFVFAWTKFFQSVEDDIATIPTLTVDTHTNRLTGSPLSDGSIFYESDRQLFYIGVKGQWLYLAGYLQVIAVGIPLDLGTNDAGLLIYVTDFNHVMLWNGTSLGWGPGENGSGYTIPFAVPPTPPNGWHQANGATVSQLLFNGSIVSTVTPNIPGSYFRL